MKKKMFIFALFIGFGLSLSISSCKKEEQCEHTFEKTEELATCTKEGKIIEFCTKCGYEKDPVIIPIDKTKHNPQPNAASTTKTDEAKNNAKCGEKYNVYGECADCHEIVVMSDATKNDHQPDEEEVWFEPCDDESHYLCVGHRCAVCHEVIESMTERTKEYHNAEVKHDINQQKAIELGICSYYENTCSCGKEYTTQLLHNYNDGEYTQRPNCVSGGVVIKTCQNPNCVDPIKEEQLSPLGHAFKVEEADADCIDRECIRCHEIIEATGAHTYEHDADCFDRICTKCHELIEPKSSEHIYADNYSCHDRYCELCHSNESIIYATTDHLLAETLNKRQDCTDPDEKYYRVCDICGDSIEFSYSRSYNEHSYTVQISYRPASCEEDGYMLMKCEHCESTKETIISKSEHKDIELQDKHVDPDCTHDGQIVYQCENCKRITTVVLPSLGHVYSDSFLCHDRQCIRCGETYWHTEEHTYEEGSKVCKVCGESIQLAAPEITFNATTSRVYALEQTLKTKFYIDGEEFDGSLNNLNLAPGVYTIFARNEDDDIPAKNSENSNELKIVILGNDYINLTCKNANGAKTANVAIKKLNVGVAYQVKLECYDAQGEIISDSQGNTFRMINVSSDDSLALVSKSVNISPKTAKIKITIISNDENVFFFREYTAEIEVK